MANRTWADEAMKRLQLGQITVEREVAEDQLRLHQAPNVWGELRDWVKQNCEDLNERADRQILAFEVVPLTKLRVRRLDEQGRVRATLNAELDLEARRVRYECGAGKGEFTFSARLEDSSVTLQDVYRKPWSCEQAGRKLLNLLMDSQF